jgi:predicted anti-sigma-YlaC factor YlaD
MECSQFEALLADALDGTLRAEARGAFDAHRQSCGVCGPMFLETREGMLLLEAVPELEPPRNLVHNILAATSLAEKPQATVQRLIGIPAR